MSHEQIWAPWRLEYIQGRETRPKTPRPAEWLAGADRECFLCRDVAEAAADPAADRANFVVGHSQHALVLLNIYPYNNGHLLVAPRRHTAELSELTDDEQLEVAALSTRSVDVLRRMMAAEGFNIGMNLGKVAGAGLPGHLHWHVVPRWNGDTNYMSAVGETRVIPQSLEALWEMLSRTGVFPAVVAGGKPAAFGSIPAAAGPAFPEPRATRAGPEYRRR